MASGKPDAFTDKENTVLCRVLRELMKERKWTQQEAADELGSSQQTIARLVNTKRLGHFGRQTALALAELRGYDGPESLLRDHDALADPKAAPSGWRWRESAVLLARRVGIDDRAIERVIARYTESQYAGRPMKWWMLKFGLEDQELAEERRAQEAKPPPASTPALEARPNRRRRQTA